MAKPSKLVRFEATAGQFGPDAPGGLFQLAAFLVRHPEISGVFAEQIKHVLIWFGAELSVPDRFTSSTSKGWHRRDAFGICWFKPEAVEHMAKVRELVTLVQLCDAKVQERTTSRPGYVTYEDDVQLVAEPFVNDT